VPPGQTKRQIQKHFSGHPTMLLIIKWNNRIP